MTGCAEFPEPPRFEMKSFTADQEAMLEMIGSPEIVGETSVLLWISGRCDGIPSIAPPHVMKHTCPIIMLLGKRRAIKPNGDIWTLGSDA